MKAVLAALLICTAPGAVLAAPLVTTNGFVTSIGNQENARIDQFQAASPSLPTSVQNQINSFQIQTLTPALNTIKNTNPTPNLTSPIQPFTIPAIPPVH